MRAMCLCLTLHFLLIGVACMRTEGAADDPEGSAATSTTRTVSEDDNGGKITLQTGDRLLVKLAADWDWSLDPLDTAILKQVTEGALPRGAQALLEASGAGTTSLSLTGDPPCAKSRPPCNAPSRRFHVTVVVR